MKGGPVKNPVATLCPRCRVEYLPTTYPGALSRADNKTMICSLCGQDEAMTQWLRPDHRVQPVSEWPVRRVLVSVRCPTCGQIIPPCDDCGRTDGTHDPEVEH